VTNKAETLDEDFFSDSGWFHLITFMVLALTVIVGAWRLMQESGTNELLYVVGFWALFNLVIAGLGLGAVAERKQRRRHYRMPYAGGPVQAVIEIGESRYFGTIKDIAIGGLCVEMPVTENLAAGSLDGQTVKLSLVKGRRREDRILHTFNVDVRWNKTGGESTSLGLEFHEPNALDRRAQALLMFPNSEALARYRANRLTDIKVSQGTWTFVKWSATQTLRGLTMAFAEIKTKLDARFAPAKTETPKVQVAVAAPALQAQTQQAISAAPAAQQQRATEQRAIPAMPSNMMPSNMMPQIPVSPFATGLAATKAEATLMVHSPAKLRQTVPAPSLAPHAHEIYTHEILPSINSGLKAASTLPSPKQVPVSGHSTSRQHGGQATAAAPSREVPL
jgi:cellulose synthase (UDP-forming)